MSEANRKSSARLLAVVGALAAVAVLSLGILAGSLFTRPASAAQTEKDPSKAISTSGIGEVRVKPDMANLNFQVLVNGATAEEALAAYERAAAALAAKLKERGVAEKDIIAQPPTTSPVPSEGQPYGDAGKGYMAQGMFTVVVRDLEKLRDVAMDGLKAEQGIGISYIQYALQNDAQARAEALNKAIDNARGQADAVAAKLGLTVGEVLAVTVQPSYAGPIEYGGKGGMGAQGSDGANFTELGTRPDMVINVTVQVSYSFE